MTMNSGIVVAPRRPRLLRIRPRTQLLLLIASVFALAELHVYYSAVHEKNASGRKAAELASVKMVSITTASSTHPHTIGPKRNLSEWSFCPGNTKQGAVTLLRNCKPPLDEIAGEDASIILDGLPDSNVDLHLLSANGTISTQSLAHFEDHHTIFGQLQAGWHCLSALSATRNCVLGSIPFVVVDRQRKSSEYAVRPTLLQQTRFDWVRNEDPGVLPNLFHWLVPSVSIAGVPTVVVVAATLQPSRIAFLRKTRWGDTASTKKLNFGFRNYIYDPRSIMVNDVIELFAGKGSLWISREEDRRIEQKVGVWKRYSTRRNALVEQIPHIRLEVAPISLFARITSGSHMENIISGWKGSTVKLHISQSLHIDRHIVLPSGSVVACDLGTIITITATGSLTAHGTAANPVTFTTSEGGSYWGGIVVEDGAELILEHTIVAFAGGTSHRMRGTGTHIKDACPAITVSSHYEHRHHVAHPPAVTVNGSAVVNCLGPGFGAGNQAQVVLTHTLIQDVAQGGECVGCNLTIRACHFVDFPFREQYVDYEDKDNDALYVRGGIADISESVFMNALDDCIDSATSRGDPIVSQLNIFGSWMHNCQHEGLALSATEGTSRNVRIESTKISSCQQGLEIGHSPEAHVTHARHLLMQNNQIGLRYGDNYALRVDGHTVLDNCAFVQNEMSVLNFRRTRSSSRHWAQSVRYRMPDGSPPTELIVRDSDFQLPTSHSSKLTNSSLAGILCGAQNFISIGNDAV